MFSVLGRQIVAAARQCVTALELGVVCLQSPDGDYGCHLDNDSLKPATVDRLACSQSRRASALRRQMQTESCKRCRLGKCAPTDKAAFAVALMRNQAICNAGSAQALPLLR